MKQYIITGCLALCLILLIVGITYVSLKTVSLGNVKALSIEDMKAKDMELKAATAELEVAKIQFDAANNNLEEAKKSYNTAKDAYNSVSEDKINTIKEATKEEHYYIDWLWIVLGGYADNNNLALTVIDPRQGSEASAKGTIKIKLVGRYSDITDFVFEVENDNDLKFKLDNMVMEYSENNKVSATFDVLSMEVLF